MKFAYNSSFVDYDCPSIVLVCKSLWIKASGKLLNVNEITSKINHCSVSTLFTVNDQLITYHFDWSVKHKFKSMLFWSLHE